MSIELYFLIELLADFSVLGAVARGLGCFRMGRVGGAAVVSAAYGTLCRGQPALSAVPLQLILLAALSMLIPGRTHPREALACGLSVGVTAIVTGTCAMGWRHPSLAVLVVPPLCMLTTRLRRRSLSALPAKIEVVNQGRTSVLEGCIDTGNRLTEPLSGQPVLIVGEQQLKTLLPEAGYREVAYGSLGGGGTLRCFRPDKVYIDGRRAPDTWVALFPSRLPGAVQALAPAEYVLY